MTRPVCFTCRAVIDQTPDEIAAAILDLEQWPLFTGYGPLPGIRSAEFIARPPGVVGTRVAVTNTDGSTHVEEILEWDLPHTIRLSLGEFSRPLCFFADHFIETFEFETGDDPAGRQRTRLTRSFELHPRRFWARPILVLIRPLLRRAIDRSNSILTEGNTDSPSV
jgi:polyketide cyclase/dehydrase/lipid transport protein